MDTGCCTIAIATYGAPSWALLAQRRALPSARAQDVPVVTVHATSLCEARNMALDEVDTPYVVNLDADDELEPGYIEALAGGSCDVRAPAVRYVYDTPAAGAIPPAADMPRVAGHTHACNAGCLPYGNWLVIGAMVDVALLRRVGGWRDFNWSEDWSTWLRCHLAGATFEAIPAAVYRAYVRRNSRNRAAARDVKLAAHRAILADAGLDPDHLPDVPVPAGR